MISKHIKGSMKHDRDTKKTCFVCGHVRHLKVDICGYCISRLKRLKNAEKGEVDHKIF